MALEAITKEALAALGAPELVYIREVSAAEVLAETELPEHVTLDDISLVFGVV